MPLLERTRLKLFEAFVHTASRRRKGPEHLATGRRGELAAYFYLRRRGYIITARGWRSGYMRGDLDLLGWDGDTLCFIEVKTRTTRDVATAEASVDEDKRRVLRRLARHYLRQLAQKDVPTRFDVLSIYLEKEKAVEFEHFRSAFGWT